jgi:desulfoferrodoxin (superoxide reductase-like protein)
VPSYSSSIDVDARQSHRKKEEERREEQGEDREDAKHLPVITDGENDDGIYIYIYIK